MEIRLCTAEEFVWTNSGMNDNGSPLQDKGSAGIAGRKRTAFKDSLL